jgi:predicted PurR-regulated permease PerM
MRSAFFFTLIAILTVGILYIFLPFFYPIFWASVIAVIFHPLFKFINKHLKNPSLSSVFSLILVIVFLIIPFTILVLLLANESINLYQKIASQDVVGGVKHIAEWLQNTPLQPYLEVIQKEWATYATNASKTIVVFLVDNITSITQNFGRFIFMFFIMLYTLYYFFKDGESMLKRLMELSPLGNKYEKQLYKKFTSTSIATLKGTLIIGGVQGILGGITFWITGIQGALIWGVVMVILSIIPAIGPFLVWFPAGIIMLAIGNIWQGITILLVGSLLISLIDNLLRPPLVGKSAQLHPLIVLFSTLGGLLVFNISGFIIGPVIASLFLSTITIYNQYYKKELDHN